MGEIKVVNMVYNPQCVQIGKKNSVKTRSKMSMVNFGSHTAYHTDNSFSISDVKTYTVPLEMCPSIGNNIDSCTVRVRRIHEPSVYQINVESSEDMRMYCLIL